jgi:predicted ATPase
MGQVVILGGEAGIGKSRLVRVLKEHVAGTGRPWLECQGSPYYQHTALYPLTELLARRLLRLEHEATAAQQVQHLEEFLGQYGFSSAATVPLFAPLLSLPLPATYSPTQVSPEQQRQQTLHALLDLLLRLATEQPILLVMEDLHWVDPSTLEWLNLLVDQGPTTRIMALCTCRPDFIPPWTGRSHYTQVTLARLPQHQAVEMIGTVAHRKTLPPEVIEQVVAKTDGVPLFVEELTKMVLESGLLQEQEESYVLTGPLPPLAIPTTLHDSLMARLDRLAMVKGLAQLGATLGREFSYALLQAIALWDEETLRQGLQQLVRAEFLYQRGLPPQATYLFKHALIQETAYQSLLQSTRQQHHQHIAQVLEARFPDLCETRPELLAHHYTAAGAVAQAIPYWQRAGQRAIQGSANLEAIGHLSRGLELLRTLPDTPERARQELAMQIPLGHALIATKGQAAHEVGETYSRARELCQQMDDIPQLLRVLYGLWHFHVVRAEHYAARQLGEQCLSLVQHVQDPVLFLEVQWVVGVSSFFLGKFRKARAYWEEGLALYAPHQHRHHRELFGVDLGVFCRCFAAHTLWHLGYPDQAHTSISAALTLAQETAHPFSLALALDYAAILYQFRGDARRAQALAEQALTLCTAQGFAYYLAWGTIMQGWALATQGQGEAGMAQMRRGLAAIRATGAAVRQPYYRAVLAEVYGQCGHAEDGLTILAEALAVVRTTGECWWEAELRRLKGELLLAQSRDQHTAAQACFQQALAVARRQQAKALELRAAVSLSRLWQQQGKRAEARALLAPIYRWFTEGFDTADLQEARALLEALA